MRKATSIENDNPENSRRIVGIRETRVWSTKEVSTGANRAILSDIQEERKFYIEDTGGSEQYGIQKGDIIEITFADFWDFDETKVHGFLRVNAPPEKSILIGFAYKNFGELSIQYSDFKPVRFKRGEVEYLGFVSAVIKPYSPPKIFDNSQKKKPVSAEILNVTCGNCKTTASGTAEFLKAMAWSLRKNETLCNSCRW